MLDNDPEEIVVGSNRDVRFAKAGMHGEDILYISVNGGDLLAQIDTCP